MLAFGVTFLDTVYIALPTAEAKCVRTTRTSAVSATKFFDLRVRKCASV